MTPSPVSQTVEDLGKLVKTKYPGVYDSLNDADLGSKTKAKYPEAYGHFTDIQTKSSEQPQSTLGKVGNFLKGQVYDPTIGTIGQGARDVMTPGSRMKGAHEIISGAEKTLLPVGAAAAVMNPEVTLPAMALGAFGQAAGKYIPQAFGASEDVSNLTGDVAGLAAGGLGARGGPRISSAVKVAAPDVAMGIGKAGAGMATGAALHGMGAPPEASYITSALLARPGLRQAGKGLAAGAKELVNYGKGPESIVAPPGKGPSIGQLKGALKNGNITTDQFNAAVDKMTDLNPEAKELHKADALTSLSQKSPIKFPVNSPKTLSLGQLQKAVGSGRMPIENFTSQLRELGYTEEHANELTEQLKDSMKEKEGEVVKDDESTLKGRFEKHKTGGGLTNFPVDDPRIQRFSFSDRPKVIEGTAEEVNTLLPPPSAEAAFTADEPPKSPITQQQIEESQSDARVAKETKLARHFIDNKVDLDNIPITSEYLRAIGNESGLKRTPSLRTLENAINRAKELKSRPKTE